MAEGAAEKLFNPGFPTSRSTDEECGEQEQFF